MVLHLFFVLDISKQLSFMYHKCFETISLENIFHEQIVASIITESETSATPPILYVEKQLLNLGGNIKDTITN